MKTIAQRFTPFLLVLSFSLPAHAQPTGVPIPVQASAAMKKIHAEHLTAQQAWDKGILNREILLNVLNDSALIDNGRGISWPGQESDELAALFLKVSPQDDKKPLPLQANVTLRIAFYRMHIGDKKGVETLEDMLDQMPRQNADMPVVDALLYCLSSYYQGINDAKKAVETSLKIKEFTDNPLTISNQLLQAARVTWDLGDKAGAATLYGEVIACGYGWATGHAYLDMYRHKAAEGKLEEARAFLKTQFDGLNADQIRVIMYNTLANSYIEAGEWDEAAHWAQATIDQFKAIAVPIQGYGIDGFSASAENMLIRIERYKKTPLLVEPTEFNLRPGDGARPFLLQVTVRAQQPITAAFTSPDANFTAFNGAQTEATPSRSSRFLIQVSPKAFGEDRTVELTFTAKEFPGTVLKVPVHLKKPQPAVAQ